MPENDTEISAERTPAPGAETGSRPRLVVIVGPTGAGKSEAALRLAERAGAEIVSADSQQVYRGMDIGTGKVSPGDRARVRHHLIDVVDPDEDMTAARYVELADQAIVQAQGNHPRTPVVVAGGTGLSLRFLLPGLFLAPDRDEAIRQRLTAEAEAGGTELLWQRLAQVDAGAAGRIDRRDLRRIVRALEVYELTGEPMSAHQARHDFRTLPMRYEARLVGIAPEPGELYRRIDARVDAMMARGLLGEVRALRQAGYGPDLRSQQAIGYAELHAHLGGACDLARAVELVKRNSRRYARRQRSWYRADPRVAWHGSASDIDLPALERYLRAEPDRD